MTHPRPRLLHTAVESYDHADPNPSQAFFVNSLRNMNCPCCGVKLRAFEHELETQSVQPGCSQLKWLCLEICATCGWWHFRHEYEVLDFESHARRRAINWELIHAIQTEIELADNTLPLEDLQRHLSRHWNDRKHISAQRAEDFIGSLLAEHHGGQITRLTANANSADGGIDFYVCACDDGAIQRAVQVKRRIEADVESVKEVRNFVGAMALEGADSGVFVTTASRFSRVAKKVPGKALKSKFRLNLELIDGEQLLDMLYITNATKTALLPPDVEPDQVWRDESGHELSAHDLFVGDLSRWPEPRSPST